MAVKQFKNNRRKMIKERAEKGSLSRMLDTFNNKIYDLENDDFDESIDNKNHPYWMDDDVGFDIPEPDEKTTYDVCDDEDEDFEESFNIDEMAKPHTWGITYRDKYNKTKQHIIDAPDAYDAKMKARKELGIKFSDIDDAEMIENLEEDTTNNGFSEFRKAYMDAANKFLETLDEYGYSAQFSPNNDYYTVFDNNKSIGERHPIAYITLKMEK